MKGRASLQDFLDERVLAYNKPQFITNDPIQLPRRFSRLQDIEIIGFWVAMLAWGRRSTIIDKGYQLIELMEGEPYDFIRNHEEADRQRFQSFKHRTFQAIDAFYFLEFLQFYYREYDSLEFAFTQAMSAEDQTVEQGLKGFHDLFFSLEYAPRRTRKHIATPHRNSTCKRLNMFLRWMVRKDTTGVDFGLWSTIRPAQLLIPLDVHVERVARRMGLLHRRTRDWKAVLELTTALRNFDPEDPVKYDFALFGLGVEQVI